MADRIAVMRAGRILQQGPPAEVYDAPRDAFIATFLSDVNSFHGTVESGTVASPFGPVVAEGVSDGARVDILIRPEALRLDGKASERTAAATVVAVHPLGHSTIVELRLDGDGRVLRARVPGPAAPSVGARVDVVLDPSQTFVFPCDVPTSLE